MFVYILVHSVLPRNVPSHTKHISGAHKGRAQHPQTRQNPKKAPRKYRRGLSVHVSASVPPISGICTYGSRASRASRASMMAGMTVRVGTYQQYQRPSQMNADPGRLVIAATHHDDDARLDPEQRVTRDAVYAPHCRPSLNGSAIPGLRMHPSFPQYS
ncbi:hypothetical protein V490_05509 [Pseudogymnoascus sp. VKM F-3557]|nr:hypothetical protein V490_05509 [Pseudogymnoascus sp. VKM F-3557]